MDVRGDRRFDDDAACGEIRPRHEIDQLADLRIGKFDQVLQKLEAEKLSILGPIDVGCDTVSIYFYDPNHVMLEFCCQTRALDADDATMQVRETLSVGSPSPITDLRTR